MSRAFPVRYVTYLPSLACRVFSLSSIRHLPFPTCHIPSFSSIPCPACHVPSMPDTSCTFHARYDMLLTCYVPFLSGTSRTVPVRRVAYRSCQACHVPFPSGTSRTVPVRHVTYRSCEACYVPFLSGMSRILPVRHVTYHCCQACSGVCSHTPAACSLLNRPGGSCLWSSLCSRQTTGCRSPRRVGGGFLSAMDREN